jgi:hypothetical protein
MVQLCTSKPVATLPHHLDIIFSFAFVLFIDVHSYLSESDDEVSSN